uniref:Uncharacterized protein n=1 Tax=Panagrolaimus davidi TaxID=227884 RepID=A0A914Q2F3_9BILA
MEMPPKVFQTSLTREMLLQSFQEAIELNICAKRKLLKFQRKYYQKIGDKMNVVFIDAEINGFQEIIKNEMQKVQFLLNDFSKQNIKMVLYQISKLQNDAKNYLYEKMKQKNRRKTRNLAMILKSAKNDEKKNQGINYQQNYRYNIKNAIQNIAELQKGQTIEEVTETSYTTNNSIIED